MRVDHERSTLYRVEKQPRETQKIRDVSNAEYMPNGTAGMPIWATMEDAAARNTNPPRDPAGATCPH